MLRGRFFKEPPLKIFFYSFLAASPGAELVEPAGTIQALSVINVDVINDLALIKAEVSGAPFFGIATTEPQFSNSFIGPLGKFMIFCLASLDGQFLAIH
ncbi:MAG TPA: hypothetical protein VEM15_06510 [Thermodesulfobacteriota bacterium]|nr:hypothetical protein [Thermodesulfobacteriota bacterium]